MAVGVKKVFVGIDAGTTGCAVIVFDTAGNAVGQGYQEYDCSSPQPGWIEQNMDDVWRGICAATKQAVAKANLHLRRIIRSDCPASVARLACWMKTVVR